jgi:hypothetical protein
MDNELPQENAYTALPVDLQTHSTCSDGTETPSELVAHAARLGIQVLAITDHDSVLSVDEALDAGKRHDVFVLPAIEFSTASEQERDFLDINILGYGIDHNAPALVEMLQKVMDSRLQQKIRQIERLQAYGLDVPVDEVLGLAGGVPGRPHIAQVIMARNPGRFRSVNEIFEQFLVANAPNSTYVQREFSLRVEEAIELTHQAGGIAVLAHPGIYNRVRDIDNAVKRMTKAGLDGIEIWYPYHLVSRSSFPTAKPDEIIAHFDELADELHLLKTGGSDYHGKRKPNLLGETGMQLADWRILCQETGWQAGV